MLPELPEIDLEIRPRDDSDGYDRDEAGLLLPKLADALPADVWSHVCRVDDAADGFSYSRFLCPWCQGKGRWISGERCMQCSGVGLTDDETPGIDFSIDYPTNVEPPEVAPVPLPRPPGVMRRPCVDCAYRPGSYEETDGTVLPERSHPFYCHTGLVRVEGPDHPGYVAPMTIDGMTVGALVCAGWWNLVTTGTRPEEPFRDRRPVEFGDPRLPERFWSKVEPDPQDGCWHWTAGGCGPGGAYGQFSWKGKRRRAHVVAYQELVGPVPEGHDVDHDCHTADCKLAERCLHRRCVRPLHLVARTHRDNLARGNTFTKAHLEAERCPEGHPYDDRNTYHRPDRPDSRDCKRCRADAEARRRTRKRQQVPA